MKVLIVSHSPIGIYGAITSLKNLIRNCNWEVDLVYPRHYKNNASDEDIRSFFGGKINKILRLYLPYDNWVDDEFRIRRIVKDMVINVLAKKEKKLLKKTIKEGQYDYVLLNSIILYRMIEHDAQYVLYVREKYYKHSIRHRQFLKKANSASKVIFIDPAIVSPIEGLTAPYRVINNPFDMTALEKMKISEVAEDFPLIHNEKIVIAIAGVVSEVKGVGFVIEAFQRVKREDLQLLIVGNALNKDYMDLCKQKAEGNENIVFLGEQADMGKVFLLSDYALRADLYFATGRTVYEALFAGCGVIIQSDGEEDKQKMQEYERYKEKIFFYKTRDVDSLREVFEELPPSKMNNRSFRSNIDEYISQINDFLQ